MPQMPSPRLPEKDIYRLLYCSAIAVNRTADEVTADCEDILVTSREQNPKHGITGVLITNGKMFSQVIEGPAESIKNLIGHITCDTRHRDVRIVSHHASDGRSFGEWAMATISTVPGDLAADYFFPNFDRHSEILAITSFCSSVRKQLIERGG